MASDLSKPAAGYLTVAQVAAELGVSVVTLWKWRKAGKMPKSIAFGPRCVRWPEREIRQWIAERAAKTEGN